MKCLVCVKNSLEYLFLSKIKHKKKSQLRCRIFYMCRVNFSCQKYSDKAKKPMNNAELYCLTPPNNRVRSRG